LPLYPYRCTQCGHSFEKIQNFSDEPEVACPKCGGALERPLTAPRLQFKGAGWYVNDYAPKSASSPESSGGESSGGNKKESTAAPAATESKTSSDRAASAPAAAPASPPSSPASSTT